jgi:hypothetical protein
LNLLELIRLNINWKNKLNILTNPGIFEYDYIAMKETKTRINRELMEYVWNPNRLVILW